MAERRKHHKIEKLPDELVEAVNQKLVEGYTYQQVTDWLNEMGHSIGKSSVARYGKDFLSRLERLRVIKDQARAIVEESGDRPATEMAEAANQLAMQLITETLMKVDEVSTDDINKIFNALAKLESSGVQRERLKLDYKQKIDKAVNRIEEVGKKKGLDPETLQIIKEQVYGIV
ncbi:MAG: hypothetical protein PWQ93_385 [Clostridiales bacterium]|jgi:hypothetical protein|nr:hypothetical protein [Clostridiales bacterium]